jgi:hypothetical protein
MSSRLQLPNPDLATTTLNEENKSISMVYDSTAVILGVLEFSRYFEKYPNFWCSTGYGRLSVGYESSEVM